MVLLLLGSAVYYKVSTAGKTHIFQHNKLVAYSDPLQSVATPGSQAPEPETYFEEDFQQVKISNNGLKLLGWEEKLKLLPEFHSQLIATNGVKGKHVDYYTKDFNGKQVLYAEMIEDDPEQSGQTRFQWGLYLKEGIEVWHTKHKLYLSPDYAELANCPYKIRWNQINELWNEGFTHDGDIGGSARWGLSIWKDTEGPGTLRFVWAGEYMQPSSIEHDNIFEPKFSHEPVEKWLGKWFELDYYFHRDGRTVIKFDDTVIFDFVAINIYPGRPELFPGKVNSALKQYAKLNPFKIYVENKVLLWLKDRDKKLWQMYDDFRWYKS